MGQQSSSSVRIDDDEDIVDGLERLSVRGTSVRKTVAATEGIIQFQRSTDEMQKYISDYTKRFDIRWNNVVESHITNLDQFKILRTIGIGTFGQVWLAKANTVTSKSGTPSASSSQTAPPPGFHKPVAIKVLNKKKMIKLRQIEHVVNEKKVLFSLKHHSFVSLIEILKTTEDIYMVMEFVSGGELFAYIRQKRYLSLACAKFYFAQVTLALTHLHMLGIIYRDLKPENILICSKTGYIKLTDFGFAKRLPLGGRAWTLCGTPDYLAPEIILSKGYGKGVDFWAMGVLLYEMLMGFTPFYGAELNGPMGTYAKIVDERVRPKISRRYERTPYVKDVISRLLQRDFTKRMGILRGDVYDVFQHEIFGSNEQSRNEYLTKVYRQELPAEYIPRTSSEYDSSHFTDTL